MEYVHIFPTTTWQLQAKKFGGGGVKINLILLAKPHVSNQSTEKVDNNNVTNSVVGGAGG